MTLKQRRETMRNRIDNNWLQFDSTVDNIKNFIKLFIIDKGAIFENLFLFWGAIDTVSKDEWARKINFEFKKKEI